LIGRQAANAMDEFCPDEFVARVDQSVLLSWRNEFVPDALIIRIEGANRSPVLASDVLLVVEAGRLSRAPADRRTGHGRGTVEDHARSPGVDSSPRPPSGDRATLTCDKWLSSRRGQGVRLAF
jgi:hypothetical protein